MIASQHPWRYHLSSFLLKQANTRHLCDSQVQWDPNHHAGLYNARVKNVAAVEPNSLSGSIRLIVCWVLFLNEESGAGVSYFLMLRVSTSSLSWGCTQELVPGSKAKASWGKGHAVHCSPKQGSWGQEAPAPATREVLLL